MNRVGSIMTAFFTDKKVVDYDTATTADTKRYAEYYNHLLENGIYAAPSQFEAMFVSFAHTEDDIEKTCQVIKSDKTRKATDIKIGGFLFVIYQM